MGSKEREVRQGFDRWLDERIHAAISKVTSRFEKRLDSLRNRVERLGDRFQDLSHRVESLHAARGGSESEPREDAESPSDSARRP